VVIAREDGNDKYLAAYVISQPLESFLAERLRTHLRSRLPEYMIPARFVSLAAFPLTPNGKIDRLALPKPNMPSTDTSMQACRDTIEQRMVDIWESLLGVQPVRPGDNFFELGGNSLLAVRVMVEIEKAWGKRLPIVALFESPTIRQLAGMIRTAGEAPEFSCVVPIQTEGQHPPLFLIHGLGGNVLGYHALASHLSPVQPVYGVQAVGIDGKQPPLDNIPQMARRYIEEIRRVQPQGPYYLGGLSLGGVIALEIALVLQEQGQQIAALIMLDAYAYGVEKLSSSGSRFAAQFSTTLRRLALHAGNLAAVPDPFSYIRKKARTLRKRVMWRLGSRHYKTFIRGVEELPANYNAVAHAAWTAAMRYVPGRTRAVCWCYAPRTNPSCATTIQHWDGVRSCAAV
jgi:aspartate racemase